MSEGRAPHPHPRPTADEEDLPKDLIERIARENATALLELGARLCA